MHHTHAVARCTYTDCIDTFLLNIPIKGNLNSLADIDLGSLNNKWTQLNSITYRHKVKSSLTSKLQKRASIVITDVMFIKIRCILTRSLFQRRCTCTARWRRDRCLRTGARTPLCASPTGWSCWLCVRSLLCSRRGGITPAQTTTSC